ncbi:MAG TPA: tetratricopeptide repeat protein [Thiotrichaceae bacterium]|jgi:Tfp pilus assembly protein PilF|nr:tetratricopeptide repeat protein [Thiotrichaceae bacterium]HIM07660.1 tetratricopeptide repeat protein [Gammaproteobacteria bacterium]
MSNIGTFKNLLEKGNDNALLRYSLGNEYFKETDFEQAILHLEKAIEFNPDYSAAWKLYAKALSENTQINEAIIAYEKGINIAEKNGDIQAIKEMRVFLKRLKKG